MSKLTELKGAKLAARKTRMSQIALSLTTLIGEIESDAKRSGEATTDALVIAKIQKFIKNNDTVIKASHEGSVGMQEAIMENAILKEFLPEVMTDKEVSVILQKYYDDNNGTILGSPKSMPRVMNKGDLMKHLKANYAGLYDARSAVALCGSIL